MINPIQLVQLMRSNPQDLMRTMMGDQQISQNPIMKNGLEMYQRGDTQGLQNLVNNMAKQRGVSIDDIRNKLNF